MKKTKIRKFCLESKAKLNVFNKFFFRILEKFLVFEKNDYKLNN